MGILCGGPLMCLGFTFLLVGAVMWFTRRSPASPAPVRSGVSGYQKAGVTPPRNARVEKAPPPTVQRTGNTMRDQFFNARLGQNVVVKHPERGDVTGKIIGTIRYTELWQKVNSPSEPWAPTGNEYVAHWLGNFLLYEWQNHVYLLDAYEALSDQDIQQNFLPYAKRYAQSDQTAKVSFAWPPASWTITDIGKFQVARAEGDGLRLNQGATGRFIHAEGADNRALVVEDYQSGSGGQDTAWTGWRVEWEAVSRVG
jgi:hypothetical protein